MTPLDSIKTEIAGYVTQCDDNLANLDVQLHLHFSLPHLVLLCRRLVCVRLSWCSQPAMSFAITTHLITQKKGAYLAKQLQDYEASFKEMAK